MRRFLNTKNKFDIEKNQNFFDLAKEVLNNNLSTLRSYRAWQNYFTKYIDPAVTHRKKDVKEFEKKFSADFFEILFAIHLIVYLLGKKIVENIDIPKKLEADLYEELFEDAIQNFSIESNKSINKKIENEYKGLKENIIKHVYNLFEKIYRDIAPREIRKPLGEYFTPLILAERMVSEIDKRYENEIWMDNSSGFGVFLLAYLSKFGIERIDKFVCIEVNPLSVFITKVAVIFEYKNHLKNIGSFPVYWGDVLLNEKYQYENGMIMACDNFADLQNKISVVIGNPPWVSWKSMTKEYQKLVGDDWRSYDIFEKNITRKTLGACNDDLSSYFVYYSIDKFLKNNGSLKFVINLSLFKSNLVGKQFRQFNIKKNNSTNV